MRIAHGLVAAVVSTLACVAGAAIVDGCASPTCEDTATCAGSDGSLAPDQSTEDDGAEPTADASGDADAAPRDATTDTTLPDAGDATTDADARSDATTSDAMAADASDAEIDAHAEEAGDAETGDAGMEASTTEAGADASDGCVPTPENCTDGIDNDCNGKIDCEDPACQSPGPGGYSCTESAPAGWFGPGPLFDGPSGSAPACSAPFSSTTLTLNSSLAAPSPATCGCSCGGLNATCGTATIEVYNDNVCRNPCASAGAATCTVASSSMCSGGGRSAAILSEPSVTASCPPSATVQSKPPVTWNGMGEVCNINRKLVAGGCSTGSVCAENPPTAFTPTLCIWKAADSSGNFPACPTGSSYSLQYSYYGGVADTRGCGAGTCGCDTSAISCSVTSITAYTTSACSSSGMESLTPLGIYDGGNPAACDENATILINGMEATTAVSGTSCTPTGTATSSGTAAPDPTTGYTVCCSQ